MYTATNRAPNTDALAQVLTLLEARAVFDGPQRPLSVAWPRSLRASCMTWLIGHGSPSSSRQRGGRWCNGPAYFAGALTPRRKLSHSRGDRGRRARLPPTDEYTDQLLMQVYLVTCLVPDIPHPIPVISGQKGSTKSTLSRVLRRSVDPAHEELLSLPNDPNELALLLPQLCPRLRQP